ncbi:MAG: poly-gamma-glutamate biosynthesis protein PgsC [Pirellulaceae bacterium]
MDAQTLAIAVGLIVSFAFSELYGLAAGGMIVPGYLAVSLNRPGTVALTLLAAVLTFAIVRLVSHYAIIYGRRRIVMMILVGFVVGSVMRGAIGLLTPEPAEGLAGEAWFTVIGFIIPGLVALWIDRQGLVETLSPVLTSAVCVRLVLIVLGMEVLA